MPGVMVVWGNLPDEAMGWYLDEFVPFLQAKEPNHKHILHAELTDNGMDDQPAGMLDSPWPRVTIYEERDTKKSVAATYDKSNHPSDEKRPGLLDTAQFDVRVYKEAERWASEKWQHEAWDGAPEDVMSVACMEWSIAPEMHAEVVDFYLTVMVPTLSRAPEMLRIRLFEVLNATVWKKDSYTTQETSGFHTFFLLMEMDSEDWPWEELMELSNSKQWRQWFENQTAVKWQVSHYLVTKWYPPINHESSTATSS